MSSNASKTLSAALCGAAALSLGLTGCGASFEGSGWTPIRLRASGAGRRA